MRVMARMCHKSFGAEANQRVIATGQAQSIMVMHVMRIYNCCQRSVEDQIPLHFVWSADKKIWQMQASTKTAVGSVSLMSLRQIQIQIHPIPPPAQQVDTLAAWT